MRRPEVDGIRSRVTDSGSKHSHYYGPLQRDALAQGPNQMNGQLIEDLASLGEVDERDYRIEFYGTQSLGTFLNTVLVSTTS